MVHVVLPYCYVRILKESRRGQGQKVRGRKRIQLIAIDYHAATGTARMGSRGDQRSKVASQPESRTDSSSLTEDTRVRGT